MDVYCADRNERREKLEARINAQVEAKLKAQKAEFKEQVAKLEAKAKARMANPAAEAVTPEPPSKSSTQGATPTCKLKF